MFRNLTLESYLISSLVEPFDPAVLEFTLCDQQCPCEKEKMQRKIELTW